MKYFIVFTLLFSYVEFSSAQDTSKTQTAEPLVDSCDVNPMYPGGEVAMYQFIQKNISYPEIAREMGEQGTVYVQFIVNSDGSTTDIKVLKGVSHSLDEEALRVVKLMPNWIPGICNGQAARIRVIVPIAFKVVNK